MASLAKFMWALLRLFFRRGPFCVDGYAKKRRRQKGRGQLGRHEKHDLYYCGLLLLFLSGPPDAAASAGRSGQRKSPKGTERV